VRTVASAARQIVAAALLALGDRRDARARRVAGARRAVPLAARRAVDRRATPIQTHGMEIDLAHPPTSFFALPVPHRRAARDPSLLHVRALREVDLVPERPRAPPRARRSVALEARASARPDARTSSRDRNVLSARVRNPPATPRCSSGSTGSRAASRPTRIGSPAWEGDPVAYARARRGQRAHPDAGTTCPRPGRRSRSTFGGARLFGVGGAPCSSSRCAGVSALVAHRAPVAVARVVALFWALFFRKC
jgi:hypothetical protein